MSAPQQRQQSRGERSDAMATPAQPRHLFVADDDDDDEFFAALSSAVRRPQQQPQRTPTTIFKPPQHHQQQPAHRSQTPPPAPLQLAAASASRPRPPSVNAATLPDESPAPKVPRREGNSAATAAPAAPAAPAPLVAPAPDRESTAEASPEGLVSTHRKIAPKRATRASAMLPPSGRPAAVSTASRGVLVFSADGNIADAEATQEGPRYSATPAGAVLRNAWVGEPLTATQEALEVADGYVAPSPPPFFVQSSVSQPRVEDENAAELWKKSTRDFFAFIDSRPLVVAEKKPLVATAGADGSAAAKRAARSGKV